jgi:hypothetical protein
MKWHCRTQVRFSVIHNAQRDARKMIIYHVAIAHAILSELRRLGYVCSSCSSEATMLTGANKPQARPVKAVNKGSAGIEDETKVRALRMTRRAPPPAPPATHCCSTARQRASSHAQLTSNQRWRRKALTLAVEARSAARREHCPREKLCHRIVASQAQPHVDICGY